MDDVVLAGFMEYCSQKPRADQYDFSAVAKDAIAMTSAWCTVSLDMDFQEHVCFALRDGEEAMRAPAKALWHRCRLAQQLMKRMIKMVVKRFSVAGTWDFDQLSNMTMLVVALLEASRDPSRLLNADDIGTSDIGLLAHFGPRKAGFVAPQKAVDAAKLLELVSCLCVFPKDEVKAHVDSRFVYEFGNILLGRPNYEEDIKTCVPFLGYIVQGSEEDWFTFHDSLRVRYEKPDDAGGRVLDSIHFWCGATPHVNSLFEDAQRKVLAEAVKVEAGGGAGTVVRVDTVLALLDSVRAKSCTAIKFVFAW